VHILKYVFAMGVPVEDFYVEFNEDDGNRGEAPPQAEEAAKEGFPPV
jgi:hypothetical protein